MARHDSTSGRQIRSQDGDIAVQQADDLAHMATEDERGTDRRDHWRASSSVAIAVIARSKGPVWVGAHIRRVNPRGQPVKGQGRPGGTNNTHRLIRRGLPYGPVYVPGQPDDGIERGLLGYFICSNIENQYEFVLKEWVEDAAFVGRIRLNPNSKDPIIGVNDPAQSMFEIPQAERPPLRITGFPAFVTTRAVAYCFLPSVTALRFIAGLGR